MRPPRTYDVATCPKRQNTTLAHLLRDDSFDPQFCLSWGIRFEAFFREFFFSQNGGGRGKASHQPLQVQNPNFVDYPERSIVKRAGVTLPTSLDSREFNRQLFCSGERRAGESVM